MADVLCFGNLQCDILCGPIDLWPARGGMDAVDDLHIALSGNAGNVAAALARLGVPVDLAGYSGADALGEGFRALLSELGVGLSRLLRHPTAATGISFVAIASDGERSVIFANGANALFDLDAVPDSWLIEPRFISLSTVFLLPQFTGDAIARLFARAPGAVTLLNTAWDAEGRGLAFLRPALAYVDYLIVNRDEGRQLTGQEDPAAIIAALEAETRGAVIVTLGADGCLLRDEGGALRCLSAPPVAARDSTGAGDAFVAGFIAGLRQGGSLADCAELACRVAAYAVTGPGAYPRIPPLSEIIGAASTTLSEQYGEQNEQ